MRILILTNLYPPHYLGGYELQCKLHVDELVRRGHEVFVLTSRWGLEKAKVEDNVHRLLHFNHMHLGSGLNNRLSDPLRILRLYSQLRWAIACRRNYCITREVVANLKPDLVYIWHMGSVSISPVLAAQDRGILTVFSLEDYWLADLKTEISLEPRPLKRRYRSLILGLEDFSRIDLRHILAASQSLMQRYVDIGFPAQNITVIPLGIPSNLILDVVDLPNTSEDRDMVKLVFVGRLVPEKGIHVALKAIAHLVGEMNLRNIHLDVIGTGSRKYDKQLREMVVTFGIEDHVEFVGFLEHQQVIERYSGYDALLFPSLWIEPFGLCIIEAMARGVPVIATNHGGPLDIISNGESGLLIPPDDPFILANTVKKLIQNPVFANRIRLAALKTIREKYTLERIVDRTEVYLRKALQLNLPVQN